MKKLIVVSALLIGTQAFAWQPYSASSIANYVRTAWNTVADNSAKIKPHWGFSGYSFTNGSGMRVKSYLDE